MSLCPRAMECFYQLRELHHSANTTGLRNQGKNTSFILANSKACLQEKSVVRVKSQTY